MEIDGSDPRLWGYIRYVSYLLLFLFILGFGELLVFREQLCRPLLSISGGTL